MKLAEKLQICVVGGHSGRGPGPHSPLEAVVMFNPANGIWTPSTALPTARRDCCAAAQDGFVYVVGGRADEETALADFERLDVVRGCWEKLESMAMARHSFAAAMVAGTLCVAGGVSNDTIEPLALAESYDLKTKKWSELLPLPT